MLQTVSTNVQRLVFTSGASRSANTSANRIRLISPWKWPWNRHKHKRKHRHKVQFFFLFLLLALMLAFALQQVKTKYHSRITQAQRYLPHVVVFGHREHWIQMILLVLVFASNFVFAWVISISCVDTCTCACACDACESAICSKSSKIFQCRNNSPHTRNSARRSRSPSQTLAPAFIYIGVSSNWPFLW